MLDIILLRSINIRIFFFEATIDGLFIVVNGADKINIDHLTLSELLTVLSNRLSNNFIETLKLKDLYSQLPSTYFYEASTIDKFSIVEIKSLLWMDDYELYPLQIKKIKLLLDENASFTKK